MPEIQLIVTQGPYSTFLESVVEADIVSGVRLNTVMPVPEERIAEKLAETANRCGTKPLWVDLKARQLRIREFANTPYTSVTISHRVRVNLPALVYFNNGNLTGRIVDIDGNKLILESHVGRILGPGESVNIVDDSLEYVDDELFTPTDRLYIEACRATEVNRYLLSYVETAEDVKRLKQVHPGAVVAAKIENKKGLVNLEPIAQTADLLIAARGDLYTELAYPHEIVEAMETIRAAGGNTTVAASRLLDSLLRGPVPGCADIMDLRFLIRMGYQTFLLGDDICFNREHLMRALRIFTAIADLPE
jgi:pyruvate kinase